MAFRVKTNYGISLYNFIRSLDHQKFYTKPYKHEYDIEIPKNVTELCSSLTRKIEKSFKLNLVNRNRTLRWIKNLPPELKKKIDSIEKFHYTLWERNSKNVKKTIKRISTFVDNYGNPLLSKLEEKIDFKKEDILIIPLLFPGGGSISIKDKKFVIITVKRYDRPQLISTLIHEIIHYLTWKYPERRKNRKSYEISTTVLTNLICTCLKKEFGVEVNLQCLDSPYRKYEENMATFMKIGLKNDFKETIHRIKEIL